MELHFYTDGSAHKPIKGSYGGYGITIFDENNLLLHYMSRQFC